MRGLSLSRLKGADAQAQSLSAAAVDLADCELVLALTQVHQIRDGEETDGDLIDEDIEVTHWLTPDGRVETASLGITGEVVEATPTVRLRPYAEEYEGYMGNYGETMDRWYRRTALLVWPRRLGFANRAEAAPAYAMRQVLERLRDNDPRAEPDLTGLTQSWGDIVASQLRGSRIGEGDAGGVDGLLSATMSAAACVTDRDLAGSRLGPFTIEDLRPEVIPDLIRLAERHGEDWTKALLGAWFGDQRRFGMRGRAGDWISELPDLARGLTSRPALCHELVALSADSLRRRLEAELGTPLTESARQRLAEFGEPLAAVFEAIALLGAADLRSEMLSSCRREDLVETLIEALRVARTWPVQMRSAAGAPELADYCVASLLELLAAPSRDAEDWSVDVPGDCACELCVTLQRFLSDSARQSMEWPLAKPGRQHLHHRIDRAELPLTHVTRRQGRPFTLVLTKTAELFEREKRGRERARRSLHELQQAWGVG